MTYVKGSLSVKLSLKFSLSLSKQFSPSLEKKTWVLDLLNRWVNGLFIRLAPCHAVAINCRQKTLKLTSELKKVPESLELLCPRWTYLGLGNVRRLSVEQQMCPDFAWMPLCSEVASGATFPLNHWTLVFEFFSASMCYVMWINIHALLPEIKKRLPWSYDFYY